MRSCRTIHGLTVDSPFDLPAGRSRSIDPVDVRIDVEPPGLAIPREEMAALVDVDDVSSGRRYQLLAVSEGWEFLFRDTATARIDAGLQLVQLLPHPSGRLDVLPTLVAGPLLTALALLRGGDVMHASAVVAGPRAVAFAGPSGAGKSTLAAFLDGDDFQLFSDDALALSFAGSMVMAHRGSIRSRMRNEFTMSRTSSGQSPDGRFVYEPHGVDPPDQAELAAVVLPRLSPSFNRLRLHRVSGTRAILPLAAATALDGIASRDLLRRHFEAASELVRRVPVYELEVPWGSAAPVGTVRDELHRVISGLVGADRRV